MCIGINQQQQQHLFNSPVQDYPCEPVPEQEIMEQEIMSGTGISWTRCKSFAPRQDR